MTNWFGAEPLLFPTISNETQVFLRIAYGLLLLATLLSLLPQARRFFLSERWGGYGERGWRVDAVQNPVVLPVLLATWLGAGVALVAGWHPVPVAALNVVYCYYFFTAMRWRGVLRGMGAPGFITYWLGVAVFLLEFTSRHAPLARGLALLALQIDFALIMIAAGVYKFLAGYRKNQGMEFGLANPEWGYWSRAWSQVAPAHPVFRFFNEMAWGTEVVAGVLMLIPETRFIGGGIILLSFIFIATQIRLGLLCEMVIVCCVIFFHPGSAGDRVIAWLVPAQAPGLAAVEWPRVSVLMATGLWSYLLLLPFARAALSYNLFAKKQLPGPWQALMQQYTNVLGLILWRVFSADITNFFVNIYEQRPDGVRRLVSRWGRPGRFGMVAEAIVVTTLFTTLKYYPSNPRLFAERLLRYARTVPHEADSVLVFEHVGVVKGPRRFEFVPSAEFIVDTTCATVDEVTLDATRSVRAPIAASPVHEGARPGSYLPLKS